MHFGDRDRLDQPVWDLLWDFWDADISEGKMTNAGQEVKNMKRSALDTNGRSAIHNSVVRIQAKLYSPSV